VATRLRSFAEPPECSVSIFLMKSFPEFLVAQFAAASSMEFQSSPNQADLGVLML